MPIVKVCFSPMLYPLYASKETVTVVVDILRATSAICTAFEHGIERVVPVPDVEDTYFYKDHDDVILAAERGGEIVEGFRYGNWPPNNAFASWAICRPKPSQSTRPSVSMCCMAW